MLRGHKRIFRKQGRGHRLDCCDDCPHDGLEDPVLSREMLLPLPAFGNGGAQSIRRGLLLRREGLLSWRTPGVGTISCLVPSDKAALHRRRACARFGLWLGNATKNKKAYLRRAHEVSPPGTNAKIKSHSEIRGDFQSDR